jgi:hypothetical protein
MTCAERTGKAAMSLGNRNDSVCAGEYGDRITKLNARHEREYYHRTASDGDSSHATSATWNALETEKTLEIQQASILKPLLEGNV